MKVKEKISYYSTREILLKISLFVITYIILCVLIIVLPYEIQDSDSQVYSYIGHQLASTPLIKWCAPVWKGHNNNPGYFQDHPPGMFWITALFVRGGVPEQSAALCANFLYILLSLYFLYRLASYFGGSILGWGAVFGFIFTPIFLQYLIRANHEHPSNLAVIAGLYAFVRSEESWRYKALFVIALIFAVFTKGLIALILIMLALLYWVLFFRNIRNLLFILFASLLTVGIMYLFELWYQNITYGVSFWQNYIYFHGGKVIEAGFNPLNKIINFFWYLSRAIWFSAPWVFFMFYWIYKSKKENIPFLKDKLFKLCLFGAALIIFWFSLSDRKADRYIFSAYCFLVITGILILFTITPKIIQFLQKRKKLLPIYLSAILIIFTLIRIFFHTYFHRFIRFWPG